MPYGRNSEKLQRTNVFVGTTNTSNYLKDRTANRRFYPLPCRNEPTKDLFNLDDDYFKQVIAEAYELYKANYKIYFDKDDQDILLMAEAYRDISAEESKDMTRKKMQYRTSTDSYAN